MFKRTVSVLLTEVWLCPDCVRRVTTNTFDASDKIIRATALVANALRDRKMTSVLQSKLTVTFVT
jgi:hypothetical protein